MKSESKPKPAMGIYKKRPKPSEPGTRRVKHSRTTSGSRPFKRPAGRGEGEFAVGSVVELIEQGGDCFDRAMMGEETAGAAHARVVGKGLQLLHKLKYSEGAEKEFVATLGMKKRWRKDKPCGAIFRAICGDDRRHKNKITRYCELAYYADYFQLGENSLTKFIADHGGLTDAGPAARAMLAKEKGESPKRPKERKKPKEAAVPPDPIPTSASAERGDAEFDIADFERNSIMIKLPKQLPLGADWSSLLVNQPEEGRFYCSAVRPENVASILKNYKPLRRYREALGVPRPLVHPEQQPAKVERESDNEE